MRDTVHTYDGVVRDKVLELCEGHPSLLSWARVFPVAPGTERYALVFMDGVRLVVEASYDGKQEAA